MAAVSVDPATGREVMLTEAFAFNGQYEVKVTGYSGTATAALLTNIHFAIGPEDRYINGVRLLIKNAAWGDTIGFSVVDVDGLYGYGPNLVLKTFGKDWNVNDQAQNQDAIIFNYIARIPAGMYIRLAYNSVGTTNVDVRINCIMHKSIL